MSRIPRFQEHLKTGFAAEAVAAARYRAFGARAESDGLPNLARFWRRLAQAKDELAVGLLAASGQVRGRDTDLATAIAEERYENDVLYPKMIRDLDTEGADVFLHLVARQKEHLKELEGVRERLNAARGDVELPGGVDQGTHGSQAAMDRV